LEPIESVRYLSRISPRGEQPTTSNLAHYVLFFAFGPTSLDQIPKSKKKEFHKEMSDFFRGEGLRNIKSVGTLVSG
jgi:predicted LPLAT superfamily acyltransferase